MKVFAAILGLLYIVFLLVIVFCVPLSAILLICKACAACTASWLDCCVPLLIALAATPFYVIAKIILDQKEGE